MFVLGMDMCGSDMLQDVLIVKCSCAETSGALAIQSVATELVRMNKDVRLQLLPIRQSYGVIGLCACWHYFPRKDGHVDVMHRYDCATCLAGGQGKWLFMMFPGVPSWWMCCS